jgi:hypothetical protein
MRQHGLIVKEMHVVRWRRVHQIQEAIPFGETPAQRKREFQEALRKILRVSQDRNSSNKKVWTEALYLLDNPRVRFPNYKRPKDSTKR